MLTDEIHGVLTVGILQFLDEKVNGSLAVLAVLVALLPVDDLRTEHVQIERFPIVIVVHRFTILGHRRAHVRCGMETNVTGMECQHDCGIAWLLNDYIHSDHVNERKAIVFFSSPNVYRCVCVQPRERGETSV